MSFDFKLFTMCDMYHPPHAGVDKVPLHYRYIIAIRPREFDNIINRLWLLLTFLKTHAVTIISISLRLLSHTDGDWTYQNLASSPGHSQFFNDAHWKAGGPGTRNRVNDITSRRLLRVGGPKVSSFWALRFSSFIARGKRVWVRD